MSKDSENYFELGVGGHKIIKTQGDRFTPITVPQDKLNKYLNAPVPFAIKPISQSPENPENYLLKLPAVVSGINHIEYHKHKLTDVNGDGKMKVVITKEMIANLMEAIRILGGLSSDFIISELLVCYNGTTITANIFIHFNEEMDEFVMNIG
jgi:hypothetical protein